MIPVRGRSRKITVGAPVDLPAGRHLEANGDASFALEHPGVDRRESSCLRAARGRQIRLMAPSGGLERGCPPLPFFFYLNT